MHPIFVLLLDGLADRAHQSLGGQSGLEAAVTPNLDRFCESGSCGVLYAVGPGRAPSSEVAHWSMLGYRPEEFPGRAVFEALGYDPQTAGGLLVSLPAERGSALEAEFSARKLFIRRIGRVEEGAGVTVE